MKRYPRLVCCSISGYGSSGPFRDAKAYDLLIQSEVGLVSVTGTEADPAKSGIPTADIGAGMYAFSGILAGLYERELTGAGTEVEVSLFDSLAEWMGYPFYYADYGGSAPARTGTSHAAIAPYGAFRAGDGTDVVVSVQNEREWTAFCHEVLADGSLAGDPRFATGSLRVRNRTELHEAIEQVLVDLTGDEFEARLRRGRIAHARRREVREVLTHPQLVQRGRWTEVDSPVGPLRALRPPITFPGRPAAMGAIPALGEHTTSLMDEIDQTKRA